MRIIALATGLALMLLAPLWWHINSELEPSLFRGSWQNGLMPNPDVSSNVQDTESSQ